MIKNYADAVVVAMPMWLNNGFPMQNVFWKRWKMKILNGPVEDDLQQTTDAEALNDYLGVTVNWFKIQMQAYTILRSTKRPWYIQDEFANKFVYIDPYLSASDQQVIFTIARRIDNPVPTVIAADLYLTGAERCQKYAHRFSVCFIVDKTGQIIMHHDKSLLENISAICLI